MASGVQKKVLSLHVIVDVLTRDKLRKFSFGLDKTTNDEDAEEWTVLFKLFEREGKDDEFDEAVINVEVKIKAKNFPKMEATATKGFNKAQTERTLVDVATMADRLRAGKADEAKMARSVEAVIEARDTA